MKTILVRWLDSATSGSAKIAAIILGCMALIITVDVVLRYLGSGIPSSYNFVQVLMAIMAFLAFGQTQVERQHVRVDIFVDKCLPLRARRYMELLANLGAILLFALIFIISIGYFAESFEMGEYYGAVIRVPIWPARGVLLIGSVIMILQFVKDTVNLFRPKEKITEVTQAAPPAVHVD